MKPAALLAAVAALVLIASVPAWSVGRSDGDLLVTFDGGFSPTKLPRNSPAPVGVQVGGSFRSVAGDQGRVPQLRRIVVAINREGKLFDRGLQVCEPSAIHPSTMASAREVCGDAIIGSGRVVVQVRIPDQFPFDVPARLLVFNGPRRDGHKLIYAEAYARNPPGAFLLTFRLTRRGGTFGTVLSTNLPTPTRDWAYLTRFELRLHRLFTYQGRQRSLVSASCPAPPGFREAVFDFAKATYVFANGQRLSLAQTGTCRVAGK